MELMHVVEGDRALLYMERYVDEGTRTYSPFAAKSEAAPQYQPRSDRPSFDLVTVVAPQSDVSVFQADPPKDLLDFYVLVLRHDFCNPYYSGTQGGLI